MKLERLSGFLLKMHFTQFFFEYVSNNLDEIPFLKQLAKLHSLCIALRRLQPDIYNTKIKPFLKSVNLNENPKIHEAINVKKIYFAIFV